MSNIEETGFWDITSESKFDLSKVKIAIAKYKLDQKINQIAQNGLTLAHRDPRSLKCFSCVKWLRELEKEYQKKYGTKFEYQTIDIESEDDNVKDNAIKKLIESEYYKKIITIGSMAKEA